MNQREIMKAAKAIVKFTRDGADLEAGINECVCCGEHYHLKAGYDPSALCDMCAQELAVAFASYIIRREQAPSQKQLRESSASLVVPCGSRSPLGFGGYRRCDLPAGHADLLCRSGSVGWKRPLEKRL